MASRIYFTAIGNDRKYNLWSSDGTTAGTARVNSPNVGFAGLAAGHFASLNGQPYFEGFDNAGNVNLFTVDATNTAVEIVTPAGSSAGLDPGGASQGGPVAFNGKLYFQGKDVNGQYGLFVSDGTGAGTVRLAVPGTSGDFYVGHITRFGNRLAFAASTSTYASGLYLTDGTAAGTVQVPVSGSAGGSNLNIQSMATAGGKLVFTGLNASFKVALWVSDGTTAGTTQLVVPGLNPSGGYSGDPSGLISFGSKAAFTAVDASGKAGVWVTDGTVAGTAELPGVTGATYGAPMAALPGGRLAFIGTDAAGTKAVFVTDGTAVTELRVAGAAASGLAPNEVMVLGNQLLFDGTAANGIRSLFTSDGTSAGTSLLQSGVNLISGNIDTDAAVVGPGPTATPITRIMKLLHSGESAVIGFASPGIAGDGLAVSLVSDPAFASGSSVTLNAQNQVVYTAGTVTTANAGGDTVRFRVTDTVTGQVADASVAVTLLTANQGPSPDPLFDVAFYLNRNPDVAAAGVDPYTHYMTQGWKEGRDPSALFSTTYYLAANPDVRAAGLNPLAHFEGSGWREGRNPSAAFDTADYLAANADVRAAGIDPLVHYATSGMAEGRPAFAVPAAGPDPLVDPAYVYAVRPDVARAGADASTWLNAQGWTEGADPSAGFSTRDYLAANPDVAKAGINPLQHYEQSGRAEGRAAVAVPAAGYVTDPLVNAAFIYAQRPDVAKAGVDAAQWFLSQGWTEGANPDALFDTSYYLAQNPDVAAAHVDPLLHFEQSGWHEGRNPSAAFSTGKYLAANPDVRAAGVDPLLQYVQFGQAEGRAIYPA